MDAANSIGQSVRKNSFEQYNRWNELTNLIKPEFQELVDLKLLPILEANHLPKIVKDCVEWDLLHFLIECEYEEVFSNGFFRKLAFWYLEGV